MENIQTSFIFDEGDIFKYDIEYNDREVLSIMRYIKGIVRPTVEKNKLFGKIELTISENKLQILCKLIKPTEFEAVLIEFTDKHSMVILYTL